MLDFANFETIIAYFESRRGKDVRCKMEEVRGKR